MRIAICDDMPEQLALMAKGTEAYLQRKNIKAEISVFENALSLLENMDRQGECEIVLLDICMPGLSGIDIAREIRQHNGRTEIIFLTSSDEYAIDAFALKATHYLLKPYSEASFSEALERAFERIKPNESKTLVVKTEGGDICSLDIEEIRYIESHAHSQMVHIGNELKIESRRSLSRLFEELEALSPSQFFMPYKGYIVNHKAVASIETKRILLTDGVGIPLPRGKAGEMKKRHFDYMFQGAGA